MDFLTPQQLSQLLAFLVGSFFIILIPTFVGIIWKVYASNTDALKANTKAITKLEAQIEIILKRTDEIPEIQKDLNYAHAKLREIDGTKRS